MADLAPRPRIRNQRKRKKRGFFAKLFRLMLIAGATAIAVAATLAVWLFYTPSGNEYRYMAADTIITTQHRVWAKYLIGQAELDKRVAAYQKKFDTMGKEEDRHEIVRPAAVAAVPEKQQELVRVEPISGKSYKGYLMIVSDPTKLRLGVPSAVGRGEKVTSMVKRYGAIAGVNAGGFADPNWKGNGFQPIGVVISQGKILYEDLSKSRSTQIVGLDKTGKMIAGNYTMNKLEELGIQEAVTFQPRLIVNGKGLVRNHADGWGIAPRTAMGQTADGTILFVVIDGRQPGYSIGADLYDVQQILLDHGAVIAANLDGGSSTVLVHDGGIVNQPSSQHGERYLPTAFLVFENPEAASIPNVWKGLKPSDIDASKW